MLSKNGLIYLQFSSIVIFSKILLFLPVLPKSPPGLAAVEPANRLVPVLAVPKPPNPELAVLVPPKEKAGFAAVLAPNKPPPVEAAAPKPPNPKNNIWE